MILSLISHPTCDIRKVWTGPKGNKETLDCSPLETTDHLPGPAEDGEDEVQHGGADH